MKKIALILCLVLVASFVLSGCRKPTASAENPLDERKAEGGPGAEAA